MIRSFRNKSLERFFGTSDGRRLSVQNPKRIANILRALDDASRPEDMNLPGFRLLTATRSTPAGIGGSHLVGTKAKPPMSIWKTIIKDTCDDQEASEARIAAHASGRTAA
jgi:plasmid maintenance system killer protein